MTSHEAAVLSCRMLALYVFFQALSVTGLFPAVYAAMVERLPAFPAAYNVSHSNFSLLLSYVLPFPLFIAFAVFLWSAAPWFAKRIVISIKPGVFVLPISMREVQVTAFVIIGVLLLVQVVPEAVKAIVTAILLTANPEQAADGIRPEMTAGYWALIIRFALIFILIFRAFALSDALDKLRGVQTTNQ